MLALLAALGSAAPRLSPVRGVAARGQSVGHISFLDGRVDALTKDAAALGARVRREAAAVERDGAQVAALSGRKTATFSAEEPAEQQSAGPAPAGLAAAKKQLEADKSALAKDQAALAEDKELLGQTSAARQQLVDATGGDAGRLSALMSGKINPDHGFYAARVKLDEAEKTIRVDAGPCGDYPVKWCHAAPDSVIHFGDHAFLNRECVAYAAWARWSHGQKFATGNAGTWPGNAPDPTVGSVAVWNAGTVGRYGHVAYVTAVDADSIMVSEFNWHPFLHSNRVIKRGGRGWPSRFWH